MDEDVYVTGTLIWYYFICPREVWLMGRNITPDEDDPNIELGRFISQDTYKRDKKEIAVGHAKLDILRNEKGYLVVGEIKKSSKYVKSAKMQLIFYLMELKEKGIDAKGELLFPNEKEKINVELSEDTIAEIEHAKKEIINIIKKEEPPIPTKKAICNNCGYAEFCWS